MTGSRRWMPGRPRTRFLVLDADTEQQHVIDMVRAGDSLVVSTPPGTGQTQTAINAISALVHDGRTRAGGGGAPCHPERTGPALCRSRAGLDAAAAQRADRAAAAQGATGAGDRAERKRHGAETRKSVSDTDRAPAPADGPRGLAAQRPPALGLLAVPGHAVAGRADVHPPGPVHHGPAQAQRAGQHPGPQRAGGPAAPGGRTRRVQQGRNHQLLAWRAPGHPQGNGGGARAGQRTAGAAAVPSTRGWARFPTLPKSAMAARSRNGASSWNCWWPSGRAWTSSRRTFSTVR